MRKLWPLLGITAVLGLRGEAWALPSGCMSRYACYWACTQTCTWTGSGWSCDPEHCELHCDWVEDYCFYPGEEPVDAGPLPSPPGPPGNARDVNGDGKLDCWKQAVKEYDPLSEIGYCQQYGATSPPCSRGHVHRGQDVVSPCGSSVRAPGRGYVRAFGNDGDGKGNYVKIQLDSGEWVMLFHLATFESWVRVGARTYPGQIIAAVGNTGCDPCGCHLHLQVQTSQYLQISGSTDLGNTLDPRQFFGDC